MSVTVIDAVLFDKDGVLIDFDRTWGAWGRRFIEGVSAGDSELRARLAQALVYDEDAEVFLPESPLIAGTSDTWLRLITPLLPDRPQEELVANAVSALKETTVVAPVDLPEVLDALRDLGLPLGIATNDGEESARRQMAELGVVDRFDKIMGFDSGYGAKPEPGMQLAFAEHLGVAPGRIAMVGDSTHDLFAGAAAGMICVAVLSGPASRQELAPHAHVTLPDIAHLPQWITRHV